jgi:hypothetical protein
MLRIMRRTSAPFRDIYLALSALAVAGACGGNGPPSADTPETRQTRLSVRDSAGVVIARSHGPEWSAGEGWRLSAEPIVTIGASADGSDALHRVTSIAPLSDGRFVVGHDSRLDLVWFDSAGAVQLRAGREGAGPGEFEDISRVFVLDGDSIVVADRRQNRLSIFGPDGTFVRDARLAGGRGENERPLVLLSDRTLLTRGPTRRGPAGSSSVILRDTLHLGRYNLDGRLEGEIGPFPMSEVGQFTVHGMPFVGFSVFGKTTHLAAAGEGFWIGTGDRPELELRAPDGTLRRVIRWADAPEPVTDSVIGVWEAAAATRLEGPEDDPFFAGMRETASLSATIPTLAGLLVDPSGHLWVEPFRLSNVPSTGRFRTVFTPDGRRLGDVRLPDHFRPMAVTADRVYGVSTDELDVETVQVFALETDR